MPSHDYTIELMHIYCSYLFLFYLQAYTALEKNMIYSLLRVVLLLVWKWERWVILQSYPLGQYYVFHSYIINSFFPYMCNSATYSILPSWCLIWTCCLHHYCIDQCEVTKKKRPCFIIWTMCDWPYKISFSNVFCLLPHFQIHLFLNKLLN